MEEKTMFVHRFFGKLRLLTLAIPLGLCLTLALPLTASAHTLDGRQEFFKVKNLVSDQSGVAPVTDPNLVNSWGIVAVPDGPFWIADNGTGVATKYDGKGTPLPKNKPLVVTIPPPGGSAAGTTAAPTGVVLNQTDDFVISKNGKYAPAQLLFATEDGTISGWNPKVDLTNAILAFPSQSQSTTAVYKGLAQGRVGSRDFLFATDFHNGVVDVFDAHFNLVNTFTDTQLATTCPLPGQCFAPFGIRNIGGKLFVTFALQDADKHDDVPGPGNGFVDVFSTSGRLLKRLISHGVLDSPWGLAVAPRDFDKFGGALLVGNFGHEDDTPNASINAFDIHTGKFLGSLIDEKTGKPIFIDGLWGLTFGDDVRNADPDALYFTAGPDHESHGLFGKITQQD
jgi:uncharacterized protein (TIGR03118 family)